MLDPLSKIAINHGTDKFGYHDYTPNYHKLLKHLRDKPVRLLEIGVGGYGDENRGGQSLATWRDYLPLAEITGIDIQKKTIDLGPRVAIRQGSQIDERFLRALLAERGPFDVVIDDGSHRNEHIVATFGILWPELAAGGIYIVEDVQTSFIPSYGGSLSLKAPNAVGHFRDLFTALGGQTADKSLSLAAIERFHNIIALHKKAPRKASRWAGAATLEKLPEGQAALVLPAAQQGVAGLNAALAALPMPGALVIEGNVGPDHALAETLAQLWVQIDHREIRLHFPDAEIGAFAREVYSLEKHADGVIIFKAPNDYPSNFAFDPNQPEAAAALAAMAEELENCREESGLLQFASIQTSFFGREAALPWLQRLGEIGADSQVYFRLAGALAQHQGRFADAAELFRAGIGLYPADLYLTQGLASALLAQGEVEAAGEAVAETRKTHPDNVDLALLAARISARLGDLPKAIALSQTAAANAPPKSLSLANLTLAGYLVSGERCEEARALIAPLVEPEGKFAARALRLMSAIELSAGDRQAAIKAIERAIALAPESKEYERWRTGLTAAE